MVDRQATAGQARRAGVSSLVETAEDRGECLEKAPMAVKLET